MYPLVSVPSFSNKKFFDFTKEEAKQYMLWFLSIKRERIEILEKSVQNIFPEWRADYTEFSLINLYVWFGKQVAYKLISKEEKSEIENQIIKTPLFVNVIPIPESTFTDETVSICFDVGCYFGETLIFNDKEIKWLQKLNSLNYIYYGQPLVSKTKSKVPLNPRASMEGIARRILDRDVKEITFLELYSINIKRF